MNAKEFYEYQLNDKTSAVGIQGKEEIIMLMEEYHKYRVKNCSIPDVSNRSELLCQHDRSVTNRICDDCGRIITYVPDDELA